MIEKLGAETEQISDKYSFVNRSTQLWNQLPAEAFGILFVN
jgi:hypothetical protein